MFNNGGFNNTKPLTTDQNLPRPTKTSSGLEFELPVQQINLNKTINIERRSTLTSRSPPKNNLLFSDILNKAVKSLSPVEKTSPNDQQEQMNRKKNTKTSQHLVNRIQSKQIIDSS